MPPKKHTVKGRDSLLHLPSISPGGKGKAVKGKGPKKQLAKEAQALILHELSIFAKMGEMQQVTALLDRNPKLDLNAIGNFLNFVIH